MYYIKKLSDNMEDLKLNKKDEEKMINYSWPGNVRELRNIAERYVIFKELDLGDRDVIESDEQVAGDDKSNVNNNGNIKISGEKNIDLKEINRFVEEKVIEMLSNQGMNKTEIAKQLGISRTALWKKTKTEIKEDK
jgi:propionate catabolism operon transcriptional regulator